MADDDTHDDVNLPTGGKGAKIGRGGLQVAGSIPGVGGIFSAVAGAWS